MADGTRMPPLSRQVMLSLAGLQQGGQLLEPMDEVRWQRFKAPRAGPRCPSPTCIHGWPAGHLNAVHLRMHARHCFF